MTFTKTSAAAGTATLMASGAYAQDSAVIVGSAQDGFWNMVKKGVDAKKFSDAFNSYGVMSKVKRGDQLAQAYKIQGVPALAVEGKFLIGGKDFNDTLAIADSLISKARSEKSGKAPAKK